MLDGLAVGQPNLQWEQLLPLFNFRLVCGNMLRASWHRTEEPSLIQRLFHHSV